MTPEHMDEFLLFSIASEFQGLAPDVYSLFEQLEFLLFSIPSDSEFQGLAPDVYSFLFEQLGHTHRYSTSEEEMTLEQHKMVTSLSTLLNARSRQARGLQLQNISYVNFTFFLYIITYIHEGNDNPKPCWNMHFSAGEVISEGHSTRLGGCEL